MDEAVVVVVVVVVVVSGGRQCISPVDIYRKCMQRIICLLHRKKRLFGKTIPSQ